jgi:hypothetical protein
MSRILDKAPRGCREFSTKIIDARGSVKTVYPYKTLTAGVILSEMDGAWRLVVHAGGRVLPGRKNHPRAAQPPSLQQLRRAVSARLQKR